MKTGNKIRCSSPAVTYGSVLYGMDVPEEAVAKTREIFTEVPQLREIFINPTIPVKKKYTVIDRVFPDKMRNFLKTACRYQRMDLLEEIFAAYDRCADEEEQVIRGELYCVIPPEEAQKKGMEKFLCEKYNARKAQIEVRHDASVLGGFILRVGSDEYDWSVKGRLDRLAQSLGAANI